ncbi:TcpQ domain-containing protein [Vibrio sp. Hal054]|uniref:TcpQ domain-containing protein n=1 Tax=Vibrio sp. Hal054 TaxID=3035158 RepID=UPI00301C750A
MKTTLLPIAALVCASFMAHAGVYVSYESIEPTTDMQLKKAQINALNKQTEALTRSTRSSEFMMTSLIELQREERERSNQKLEQAAQMRVLAENKQHEVMKDQLELTAKQSQVQNDIAQRRLMLQKEFDEKNNALIASAAQTQQAIYEEQNRRMGEFLEQQKGIQKHTSALQEQVAKSQEALVSKQFELNAPSNMVIVRAEDANHAIAKVSKNDAIAISEQQTVTSDKAAPKVNLNAFISSVIPSDWKYEPEASSVILKQQISLVTGRDWKEIIKRIAVEHPYLEFKVDTTKKVVSVKTMNSEHTAQLTKEPIRAWNITKNLSLKQTILKFGEEANWQVIWDTNEVDYPIVANATITASFSGRDGIVNKLMKSTAQKDFPLIATWNTQNNAVVITRRASKVKSTVNLSGE